MTKKEKSFEEIMNELSTLVNTLENGDIKLEDAVLNYESGMKLIKKAQSILNDAQKKIEVLENGQIKDYES